MGSRPSAVWRAGQVDQQRKVLAPQELSRSWSTVDGYFDRPKNSTCDHATHRAAMRESASCLKGRMSGSASTHSSTTRLR